MLVIAWASSRRFSALSWETVIVPIFRLGHAASLGIAVSTPYVLLGGWESDVETCLLGARVGTRAEWEIMSSM